MWTSETDFQDDLFSFSEIEGGRKDYEAPVPQSLLEWEATNGVNQHRSVFDTPSLSDDATYIVSGRGRGGISTIIRPGEAPRASASMEEEIRKKLREVSGPGFSNELIEDFVRRQHASLRGEVDPAIKLQPSTSTFSRSNRSTPNSTFRAYTPTNSSTKASHSPPSISSKSRCSSRASEAEAVDEAAPNPPPLSTILKRAKDDAKKKAAGKLQTHVKTDGDKNEVKESISEETNDYWWENASSDTSADGSCWSRIDPNKLFDKKKSKKFDINSREDFPGLK